MDLIPLFSQVMLGGRCRYCRQPISWRYFAVELATAVLFVLVGLRAESLLQLGANAVLVSCLIAICCIDLEFYIIPDELSLTPALVGVGVDLYRLIFLDASPYRMTLPWFGGSIPLLIPGSILGLIVGSAALRLVGWLGTKIFRKESMGAGDVKLAGAVGAYLGMSWHLLTFFLVAIILGACVGIILVTMRKRKGRDYIPFGPMLVAGAIVALLWGDVVTPLIVNVYSIH